MDGPKDSPRGLVERLGKAPSQSPPKRKWDSFKGFNYPIEITYWRPCFLNCCLECRLCLYGLGLLNGSPLDQTGPSWTCTSPFECLEAASLITLFLGLKWTRKPTHDLHHEERQLRPSQNIQQKKDVKSILFPTYPPAFHPHSFVVPGRISNLGPLSKRTTTPAVTKYSKEKDVKSIIFPNQTFSTHVHLWRRTGEPTHDLHHQERQLQPSQNIQQKKMLNRFYFPPTLPHSTHIRLWCRAGYPT
ncbi:hypothetical protein TNCV_1602551 [Trichonephila clavipes]|nr:hypothetical protein TNCV_1602551 [Trichonephila clavipes]